MSWFLEAFELPSVKNGTIFVRRFFGVWRVTVHGYDQSSRYIREMWRLALKRIPKRVRIRRVLVLGLGAGSIFADLKRRFRGCEVTVIEWDPVMVDLSKRLALFGSGDAPQILVGDALDLVPTLEPAFDLIVFDLYRGEVPEPRLASPDFLKALHGLLAKDGYFLVNVFKTPALLQAIDARFARSSTWRYQFNRLALYRP